MQLTFVTDESRHTTADYNAYPLSCFYGTFAGRTEDIDRINDELADTLTYCLGDYEYKPRSTSFLRWGRETGLKLRSVASQNFNAGFELALEECSNILLEEITERRLFYSLSMASRACVAPESREDISAEDLRLLNLYVHFKGIVDNPVWSSLEECEGERVDVNIDGDQSDYGHGLHVMRLIKHENRPRDISEVHYSQKRHPHLIQMADVMVRVLGDNLLPGPSFLESERKTLLKQRQKTAAHIAIPELLYLAAQSGKEEANPNDLDVSLDYREVLSCLKGRVELISNRFDDNLDAYIGDILKILGPWYHHSRNLDDQPFRAGRYHGAAREM